MVLKESHPHLHARYRVTLFPLKIQTHSSGDVSVHTHLLNVNIGQQQLNGASLCASARLMKGVASSSSSLLLFLSLSLSQHSRLDTPESNGLRGRRCAQTNIFRVELE